jgi:hypothetical protein
MQNHNCVNVCLVRRGIKIDSELLISVMFESIIVLRVRGQIGTSLADKYGTYWYRNELVCSRKSVLENKTVY